MKDLKQKLEAHRDKKSEKFYRIPVANLNEVYKEGYNELLPLVLEMANMLDNIKYHVSKPEVITHDELIESCNEAKFYVDEALEKLNSFLEKK